MKRNNSRTRSKPGSTGNKIGSAAARKAELVAAIWLSVAAIPAGKVASYRLIARLSGYPGHARYVGTTLKQLPRDSALPWHRVLRSNGGLAFPAGSAVWHKQKTLLETEGVVFKDKKVPLKVFLWQP